MICSSSNAISHPRRHGFSMVTAPSQAIVTVVVRCDGRTDMTRHLTHAAFALLITTGTAAAQNAAGPGSGNALAIKQAESSAPVSSARRFILQTLNSVEDVPAREGTHHAIHHARNFIAQPGTVTE